MASESSSGSPPLSPQERQELRRVVNRLERTFWTTYGNPDSPDSLVPVVSEEDSLQASKEPARPPSTPDVTPDAAHQDCDGLDPHCSGDVLTVSNMSYAIANMTLSAGDDSSDDSSSLPVDPEDLQRDVGLRPKDTKKASDNDTYTYTTEPTADSGLSDIIRKSGVATSYQSTGGRLTLAPSDDDKNDPRASKPHVTSDIDISQFLYLLSAEAMDSGILVGDDYYRAYHKSLSKIDETAGRTEAIEKSQIVQGKKQDTMLENQDTMLGNQDKSLENDDTVLANQGTMLGKHDKSLENDDTMLANQKKGLEGINTLLAWRKQWEEDNGPSAKVLQARAEARAKNEFVERLRAQRKADDLEALLEKERRIRSRLRRKPPVVLSDSSNAAPTEPEQKAEDKHVIRRLPDTKKKAAAKKSERAPFGRSRR